MDNHSNMDKRELQDQITRSMGEYLKTGMTVEQAEQALLAWAKRGIIIPTSYNGPIAVTASRGLHSNTITVSVSTE